MIRNFLLIAFLSLCSVAGFAQSEKYIFHEVVKGDTKYSISKKYNISIEELEKFNPEIKSGLRVSTKLLIPKELMQKDEKPEPARTVGPGFTTYKVQAGETLYSIAKANEVSVADIRQHNPQLADGLKAGMELSIPPKSVVENKTYTQDTGDKTHKVKEGETLYSLAIHYHIGVADIKEANPQLKQDGLKAGMILTIPEPREEVKEEVALRDAQKAYYVHKVKKKETAYSLSRQYNISLDSLYTLNPEASNGLQIGQELYLPANRAPRDSVVQKPKEKLNTDEEEIASVNDSSAQDGEDENYFLYKVKSGDSFYSLKTRYNVTQGQLEKLNPELKRGLEVGKYIIIPQEVPKKDVTWLDKLFAGGEDNKPRELGEPSNNQQQQKNRLNKGDTIGKSTVHKAYSEDSLKVDVKKKYTVGLMLPFDALTDTTFNYEKDKVKGTQRIALEFYNGFLMAADTLAKQGMHLNLNVYDSRKSLHHLKQNRGEFVKMNFDMVVGPLFRQNVEYIADELRKQQVPVISPLSKTVDVKGRPNLIKCIPEAGAEGQVIADMLNDEYRNAKVIFAYSEGNEKDIQEVKARLLPRDDGSFINNVTFGEEMIDREALEATLDPDTLNVVIIFSEDPVFLSDLVAKLRLMRDYKIAVVGPAKLLDIPTLEMDYLNRLNLSMPDDNYIDYQNEGTRLFISKYREKYHSEPSQFAFQGYDVGLYFLEKLWKRGPYMLQDLGEPEAFLGTGFRMEQIKDGGYTNQFMFLTGIRGLTLVKLSKE